MLVCLSAFPLSAKFDYSTHYTNAVKDILSLKFDAARAHLAKEKAANPGNSLILLAEDYIDFFTILINDKQAEYDLLLKNKSVRLSAIEKDDKNSPWYNYARAEIYVHWATNRIRFGDYFKAATEIREAYKLLEENIEKFPGFLPNKKTMGMLEALVGTVPENYQWAVNIIGLDGNIEEGIKKIESVINSTATDIYIPQQKQEALFIYSYLELFVLKNPSRAWQVVEKNTADYKSNLLNCYLRANIALKCKKTDIAIETLKNRPRGKEFAKFYFLDYLMGQAKLFKGDDDAVNYFKTYVSLHTGKNFIKSAYVRISWYYFLKNDNANFKTYRAMAVRYGVENVEEDKQAMKEADGTDIPDYTILKGRLYFDGGYYTSALNLFNTKTEASYTDIKHKLEYNYRKARVLHESGKTSEAIDIYKIVMDKGKDLPYYFAAYSCLQLGIIYEDLKLSTTACDYYKRCSKFPTKEYKNSISSKAKMGMKRLGCD